MARRETTARRYAEAAFAVARDEGRLDAWEGDLGSLVDAIRIPELRRLVEHPAVPGAEKERILERVLGERVGRGALRLAQLMVRRGRPGAIEPMAAHFGALLRRHRGIALAQVRSALPLGEEQSEALAARLAEMTGQRIEMNVAVDEGLIGGVAVRIGDRLIDGSVRSRLERLRARLTAV